MCRRLEGLIEADSILSCCVHYAAQATGKSSKNLQTRRLKLGLVRKDGKGGTGCWTVENRFPNLQKAMLKLFKKQQGPETVCVRLPLISLVNTQWSQSKQSEHSCHVM